MDNRRNELRQLAFDADNRGAILLLISEDAHHANYLSAVGSFHLLFHRCSRRHVMQSAVIFAIIVDSICDSFAFRLFFPCNKAGMSIYGVSSINTSFLSSSLKQRFGLKFVPFISLTRQHRPPHKPFKPRATLSFIFRRLCSSLLHPPFHRNRRRPNLLATSLPIVDVGATQIFLVITFCQTPLYRAGLLGA